MEEYSDRPPADVAWDPMVPIRDVVIFPFTKVAFKIGRAGSVRALEQALAKVKTKSQIAEDIAKINATKQVLWGKALYPGKIPGIVFGALLGSDRTA